MYNCYGTRSGASFYILIFHPCSSSSGLTKTMGVDTSLDLAFQSRSRVWPQVQVPCIPHFCRNPTATMARYIIDYITTYPCEFVLCTALGQATREAFPCPKLNASGD
ncbi:unnamed protein product [Protopolystoma xenopodis]|uniref:Uncharacterized protein n=1 Tax=Protopolystoma xenopodis TaxID=117903 RepID=A0A3S5B0N9_9PLAT|nr:unnamed protein product [Protopolystoma xenopodis]